MCLTSCDCILFNAILCVTLRKLCATIESFECGVPDVGAHECKCSYRKQHWGIRRLFTCEAFRCNSLWIVRYAFDMRPGEWLNERISRTLVQLNGHSKNSLITSLWVCQDEAFWAKAHVGSVYVVIFVITTTVGEREPSTNDCWWSFAVIRRWNDFHGNGSEWFSASAALNHCIIQWSCAGSLFRTPLPIKGGLFCLQWNQLGVV